MKNIKKIAIILVIAMVATLGIFALTACNKGDNTVEVIEIKLTDEEYAFAVNKSDTAFLADVNAFVEKIKADGTLNAIIDKYFGDDTNSIVGIDSAPLDASKNQLVVATNAQFPPFEYKIGNKFAGIDMEIAKLLADELDLELVIEDMEFASIITSVNTGQADIGMAGLTVSETRKESVNFSNSYYNASQMLIVKKGDTTFEGLTTAKEVEAKLSEIGSKKVGVQEATVGKFYVAGDEDWGFDGFSNLTVLEYATGALAVQAMINGNVDYVVIDEMPAKLIAKNFNEK